ncbi:creatininase family protein, partial [Streptomyces sp. NPDC058960]
MAFGGTLTLTLPTLHALLRDICRSVIRAGFSRILIVNPVTRVRRDSGSRPERAVPFPA